MIRSWYKRIAQAPDDLALVPQAAAHFEDQYHEACAEAAALEGTRLIAASSKLPGIVGYRYEQYNELKAIIELLEVREVALLGVKRRHYLEHYNRALSDRMVENYTTSDTDIIALRELRGQITRVCRQFEALSRQHEYLHYQLGNIAKLRIAGLDDAIL